MANIIGTWDVTISTPMGAQVVSLEFIDEHSGVARRGADTAPLEDVSVTGDDATFSVKVTQPISITAKCAVSVDGDTMTGTASAGFFGKVALSGTRAAA
jgi:hypothetical protein